MATAMASSFMVARPVVQTRAKTTAARATGRTALSVVAREAAWAPGSEAPAHLTGSMAADFGFDPLGLVRMHPFKRDPRERVTLDRN
eukprot:5720785-Pyramimonas_sp.AAC.1